ncbi:hypothetical protein MAHJHV61_50420 [Mycobacterium avium subsp. hominissuis]|nr:mce related family protein [Mycobacterium avium MAV_120709_2344]BAN29658.1 virulence factor Mce [Mycobacterium avium subsp. hominissuis TH135]
MMQRLAGSRGLRYTTIIALVAVLVGGVYVLTSQAKTRKIVGYFTSAVGLYPGDQVRVLGVPVGTIDTIDPRPTDVKITMSVSQDVKVPKDAKAIIMSPNLVAARFIQLTPAYTGGAGAGRRRQHRPGPHRRPGGVGRGQTVADPAGRPTRTDGRIDAGTVGRGDQPGRGHLRRQGRVVPQRAA